MCIGLHCLLFAGIHLFEGWTDLLCCPSFSSGVDYKISHKMRTLHVKDLRSVMSYVTCTYHDILSLNCFESDPIHRQISVHYSDTCNGRFSSCACCRAYDAGKRALSSEYGAIQRSNELVDLGIDLCFHSFDHSGGLTPLSPYLLTNNTLSYFNTLR